MVALEQIPTTTGTALIPGVAQPLIDQYSPVSHKQAIGDGATPAFVAPSWVPALERRRLAAYTVFEAYYANVARYFLPQLVDAATRREHREYGDAQLIVHQALSALLGEEQTLVVDDIDEDDEADEATETDVEEAAEKTARDVRAEWFDAWAGRNRLFLKLTEAETNAVKLGDAVYALGWNPASEDVEVRQYDPGYYFPVLRGDEDIDEYPVKVHLSWELIGDDLSRTLRRVTYELTALTEFDAGVSVVRYDDNGQPIYGRRYAWQAADEDMSTVTCRQTDASWPIEESRGGLLDLSLNGATVSTLADGTPIRDLDLGFDFIPVVHVPNTAEGARHFGRSVIGAVAQVLDDIQSTDADLQLGSSTVAGAKMKSKGLTVEVSDGSPGGVYNLPIDGDVDTVNTASVLDAHLKYRTALGELLSENSRLAPPLLGKTKGSVPSGIALQLSFGPTQSLVRELRLLRDEKYPILLRMVQRIAMVHGALDAVDKGGAVFPARIEFGSFLPADKQSAVDQITALLGAHAISTTTAVGIMIEAGFPIDDATSEVERIHAEAFTQAAELLAATGDEAAVRVYLGLEPAGRPSLTPPLPPIAPPTGGQGGSSQ